MEKLLNELCMWKPPVGTLHPLAIVRDPQICELRLASGSALTFLGRNGFQFAQLKTATGGKFLVPINSLSALNDHTFLAELEAHDAQ